MTIPARILVLDDDESWQNILSKPLLEANLQVDVAGTTRAARDLLNNNFYHVAVLDLSMVPHDATNTEGLQLLSEIDQEGLRGGMEVIMISAYANKAKLRESFRKYRVADFQDKFEFNQKEFVAEVQRILTDTVNLDLDIQWESLSQREQVVLNMEIDGERVKRDTPLQTRTADELEDVLCRLFPKAQSLLVKPLTPGMSGSTVLHATGFYKEGAAQPVVVKIGSTQRIKREYENFRAYAQPFIRGRSTNVIDLRQTTHLAGMIYSLVGGSGDKIGSFSNFYAAADVTQIQATLTHLFRETCGAWYANPGHLQLINLTDQYCEKLGLTEENLAQGFLQLKGVQGKRQLYFDSLSGRTFTNPIAASAEHQFKRSTYVCNTHGDLNADNILVDGSDHAWLIDFEHTGPGHILRDIAELDLVVRVQLLLAEDASLAERLEMEEALCQPKNLADVELLQNAFHTENPALAKAYATTVHLRKVVCDLIAKNPNANLDEYYVALLYYSMNALRFLSWRGLQRQHALLSASLLADSLGL